MPEGSRYLSNGTFGPTPQPVLRALESYIRDLEECPWEGFGRMNEGVLEAKRTLARFVGVEPEDIVYVLNVTVALNMVVRGLCNLERGQAVLTTGQEYEAIDNIWEFVARRVPGLLAPLIVGWGWNREKETYLRNLENPGTHNPCHHRAVGDAVAYQTDIGRDRVAARGRELASYLRRAMSGVTGARPLVPDDPEMAASLTAFELPYSEDNRVGLALRDRKVVVPVWMDRETRTGRIRVSTHIYNTTEEIDFMVETIREAYRCCPSSGRLA